MRHKILNLKTLTKTFSSSSSTRSSDNSRRVIDVDWRDRANFGWFLPVQTRWKDNDVYGHLNNAVYHAIYDTVINVYLLDHCHLKVDRDKQQGPIGYMVKTKCSYFSQAYYPKCYLCGLAVEKVGNSSVEYKTGMFAPLLDDVDMPKLNLVSGYFKEELDPDLWEAFGFTSLCTGEYTHVFVDKDHKRPQRIEGPMRTGFERLLINK